MIKKTISIALVLLFFISCEKEPSIKEFPIINTLDAINVDATGATFRAEVIREGTAKITSYGFVWSTQEPNIESSQKVILGTELSKGVFEARINYLLGKGFEYKIKAFATYGDKTVYAKTVTLLSEGSEQSIWSIESENTMLTGNTKPYGWSDGSRGYVLFHNTRAFSYEPEKKIFSPIANFPLSNNYVDQYSSANLYNVQYIFSSVGNSLYKYTGDEWSTQTRLPFYYSDFSYNKYFGYAYLDKLFILSSAYSYSYNPNINAWNKLTGNFNTQGYSMVGTDLNGKGYTLTSWKYINEYDPELNEWNVKISYPGVLKDYIMAFSHNNKIYFGFTYDKYNSEEWMDTNFWSYDLITNIWEKLEPFPADPAYGDIFYFFLNEKLYIGNGRYLYSLDASKL